MSVMTSKGFVGALVLASLGLVASACNTTKATVDTFAKFTSSTSPGEFIDADGVVKESQKARLFLPVVFGIWNKTSRAGMENISRLWACC